jgi:hypothetical protein
MIIPRMPIFTAALFGLLADRHLGAHVFDPANGGSILWQHPFWFFGHPEVYIVALPYFGIVSEIIPVFSRKLLLGYKALVWATVAADEVTDRHQRVSRAAELAVERARYEADRAERAFSAVEPENRLVARNLETRWDQTRRAGRGRARPDRRPRRAAARYPAERSWRNWPPTCPRSGTHPPPATKTANDCCAP